MKPFPSLEIPKNPTETAIYQSPLIVRYASKTMQRLFSDDVKFGLWRRLWVALARAQRRLGLDVTEEQIEEMERYVDDINYDFAKAEEKRIRHDVMAHVHAYGEQAQKAKGIIHNGATSCFVTDNTDILVMRKALLLVRGKLLGTIKILAGLALKHKQLPCLCYTHLQPASPGTVGKRFALWLQNFVENLKELDFVLSRLKMLGCRGATGTANTFLELFHGDAKKCRELERLIMKEFGFKEVFPISGQTYPRNMDIQIMNVLAAIAVSAYKMAQDIRVLQSFKELEEPFEKDQVGSSAMAYKRNPMRSERIDSLARMLMAMPINAMNCAATQFFERTLDDSAGRRIYLPEGFMLADSILTICQNVLNGVVIIKPMIKVRLDGEVPFLATEVIIMKSTERGASRQDIHEEIRVISMEVGGAVKNGQISQAEARKRMAERIGENDAIPLTAEEAYESFEAADLIGLCPEQVSGYISKTVRPLLRRYKDDIILDGEVTV